jgi:hypothetical protein
MCLLQICHAFVSAWIEQIADLTIDHLHDLTVQVLSEDESNVKALFRRGKAKSELDQTESAREDFLKAKKYAPEDKIAGWTRQSSIPEAKGVIQRSLWTETWSKTEEGKLSASVLTVVRVLDHLPC